MANSYARGLLFRRLTELSGLDINANTVNIVEITSCKHRAGNTKITLEAKSGGFFTGQKVYYYDRVSLVTPIDALYVPLNGKRVAWTWEIVDLLFETTGIRHLKEEIVNERIKDPQRVWMAFSNSHPYWLGGFYINLVNTMIAPPVTITEPSKTPQLANGLFSQNTFTSISKTLKSLKVGDSPPEALCEALNDVNDLGWCYIKTLIEHNLMGSTVLYNGPSAKLPLTKHRHLNALKLSLNPEYCTTPYGELILYY